ncbi:MAG: ABC transporter permease subunit [Ardenticatenaceae bacterium]|nr:ABC transporter permease subunit [Ardenticatenaceae bacterium]MCB8973143.1 ABC transporter permease subunit [Ardenticatenaceae bacterium]
MFWQMVAVEQKKLTRRKILWIELAMMAAAAVFIPLVIYLASQSDGSGNLVITTDGPVEEMIAWPMALRLGIDLASGGGLGGLLIVILIGTLTAQEYGWRTMQLWLSNGISRPVLLLAKFTAVLLPSLLLVLAPFVAGALTTAVFTQNLQGSLPFAQVDWWQAALSIGRTAFTLLPYAALTFFLAVISRSTVVAIGGGLAYAMLIEGVLVQLLTFVGGTWAKIGQYLPAGLSNSLAALNRVSASSGTGLVTQAEGVSMATAVPGIALYTLLFVGLAIFAFRRQDLGG